MISRKTTLTVILLTALGAALRLYHLGHKSLWLDEALLYAVSRRALIEVATHNGSTISAPPLYAIVVHFVMSLGKSESWLRSFSCLCGTLCIPALFCLAREFVSLEASCFPALLVAIAPEPIRYSQQLREYSLTLLLSILFLLYLERFSKTGNRRDFLSLALVTVAAIFTQYGLMVMVCAGILILPWRKDFRLKSDWRNWAQLIGLAAFGAVLVYWFSLRFQRHQKFWFLGQNYGNESVVPSLRLAFRGTLQLLHFAFPPATFAFLSSAIAAGIGFLSMWRHLPRRSVFQQLFPIGLFWGLGCLGIYPYGGIRQDIFLVPVVYLLCAYGAEWLLSAIAEAPRLAAAGVAILLLPFLVGSWRSWKSYAWENPENLRPIVKTLESRRQPSDRIYIYYAASAAFTYYFGDANEQVFFGGENRRHPELYQKELDALLRVPGRVWIVLSHCYGQECQQIAHAAEPIVTEPDAALYLVGAKSS